MARKSLPSMPTAREIPVKRSDFAVTCNITDTDLGWKRIVATFKKLGNTGLAVGIFEGSTSEQFAAGAGKAENKTEKKENVLIAEYGALHEFGSTEGQVTEKRFMRDAVECAKSEIDKLTDAGIDAINAGKKTPLALATEIAVTLQRVIKERITAIHLIDTGALRNAVLWEAHSDGKKTGDSKAVAKPQEGG